MALLSDLLGILYQILSEIAREKREKLKIES
jgi:hypothetical protein